MMKNTIKRARTTKMILSSSLRMLLKTKLMKTLSAKRAKTDLQLLLIFRNNPKVPRTTRSRRMFLLVKRAKKESSKTNRRFSQCKA